jgi:hypothetical protein
MEEQTGLVAFWNLRDILHRGANIAMFCWRLVLGFDELITGQDFKLNTVLYSSLISFYGKLVSCTKDAVERAPDYAFTSCTWVIKQI